MTNVTPGPMNPRTFDILRLRAEGKTLREIGALNGITKQRVSQIIKAARLREQRERCASGVHGNDMRDEYTVWIRGQLVERVVVRCADCGEVIE